MNPTNFPLQKSYYDVLDGLRGVAALIILVYHYMEMIYLDDYENNLIGHGYLAVDFFFCLSGFVVAFAYDKRIKTLGNKNFFINRLIRLHPMVILGSLLGCLGYILDPFVDMALVSGWGAISLTLFLSLLMIPFPWVEHRGGGIFPYDTPVWSLFFEYIANIVYALILCRLKKTPLLILGLFNMVWLGYCAYRSGWLINGWALQGFSDGFARVAFSFTAGMIIYRFNWIWNNRLNPLVPILLLIGVFFVPHTTNDWFIETLLVTLVFPSIIAIGAGIQAQGVLRKCCLFLGRLSYPLYITHICTVWLFFHYITKHPLGGFKLTLLTSTLILFNLLVAYGIMKFYDEPVRRYLTRKHKASLEKDL